MTSRGFSVVADGRTRTDDLLFTKQLLYRLSYVGAAPRTRPRDGIIPDPLRPREEGCSCLQTAGQARKPNIARVAFSVTAGVRARTLLLACALPAVVFVPGKLLGGNFDDPTAAILARYGLTKATLRQGKLGGRDLRGVRLPRADLSGLDLSRADLRDAVLSGCDLTGTDLAGADLRGARLNGCLLFTMLRGADLRGSRVTGRMSGNFDTARLEAADFSKAKIAPDPRVCSPWCCQGSATFNRATYNISTRWPAGFNPVSRGASLSGGAARGRQALITARRRTPPPA
jgi:hypothetical protein